MMGADLGPLIVIPCLNEAETLDRLVAQMLADAPEGALLVVADGGSSDASCDIVSRWADADPRVRLLANPAKVQSAGINLAVATHGAGRRWLVRVDAHCTYPDAYAARLVACAQERQATCVVVPMVTEGPAGHCFGAAVATAMNTRLGTGGSPHRHVGVGQMVDHGHHALMLAEAFCAVGGYDGTYSHNEDAELDIRLGAAGARIWLEPSLVLGYQPRLTFRSLWRQYLAYARGRARTSLQHRRRLHLRQMLPILVAPAVVTAVTSVAALPAAGPAALAGAAPALAWIVATLSYGAMLGLRGKRPCQALSGVVALCMHLGWSVGFWVQLFAALRSGASGRLPAAPALLSTKPELVEPPVRSLDAVDEPSRPTESVQS